jgi:hypothetical protein
VDGNYTASLDVAADTANGATFSGAAYGNVQSILVNYTTGVVTAGSVTDTLSAIMSRSGSISPEALAFLARTTGLDATHTTAYTTLINALVSASLFPKFDMLHIYATQDATTARLNLISTSYGVAVVSGPAFTVDRGYQGAHDGSNYLDVGFNPSTAPSPKFVRDSAHISTWGVANDSFQFTQYMGGNDVTTRTEIYPWLQSDGLIYFRCNSTGSAGVANVGTTAGHWLANRSSSVQLDGYRNASSLYSNGANASSPVSNIVFNTCAVNDNGTHRGNGTQCAMASIGSSLSAAEILAFYNILRAYMTTVGVP